MNKEHFQLELFDLTIKGRSGDITAVARPLADGTGLFGLFIPEVHYRIIYRKPEEHVPFCDAEIEELKKAGRNPDDYERIYAVDPMDGPFISPPFELSSKYIPFEDSFEKIFVKSILLNKSSEKVNEVILETQKIKVANNGH